MVLRLGGTSQHDDTEFQRRLFCGRRQPRQVGDLRRPQAGGSAQPAGSEREPSPVLGPPAFHRRADVYGCGHGVPVRSGTVLLPWQGKVVAGRMYRACSAACARKSSDVVHEAFLRPGSALQQVQDGLYGPGRTAVHPARAGLPRARPHCALLRGGLRFQVEGLDRPCDKRRLLPAVRRVPRNSRRFQGCCRRFPARGAFRRPCRRQARSSRFRRPAFPGIHSRSISSYTVGMPVREVRFRAFRQDAYRGPAS